MDQQMLDYIINDAVDDFQDTIDSFIELCGSFGEAKAKAEELLPLFESIG